MTLIGKLKFGLAPVMFGDVLLSSRIPPAGPISMPAVSDINAKLPEDAWGFVTGAVQKLNIPNENLAIAWAGSRLQARLAVREIHEAVMSGASSYMDVIDLLSRKPENEVNDLSLIGVIVRPVENSDGCTMGHFHINCNKYDVNGVDLDIAGSGEWHLVEMLRSGLLPELMDGDDQQKLDRSVQFGNALSAYLIGRETESGENFPQMWGGAIETAYFGGRSMVKQDNVLHLNWRVDHVEGDLAELSLWPRFTHYRYVENHLVVSVLEIGNDGKLKESVDVFSPLLHDYQLPERSRLQPLFTHDVINCYVSFATGLSDYPSLVRSKILLGSEETVRVVRDGGVVRLEFATGFVKEVREFVRDHINRDLI
ncbi:hypothetical protein [Oricola indica]|jgi:hypothetical protein|uniref:hypothetical protein n=1 Tax=Oricola indica TaxID=2872591 RepID=UPI001CC1AFEE|nr:hypothetical protein [Oricola indica]